MRILSPGKNPAGFSLMEILVVLVLIGLAAALVLPSFSTGLTSLQLEAAARDLVTHMKSLRSKAISEQQVYRTVLHNGPEESYYLLTDAYQQELKRIQLPSEVQFVIPEDEEELVVSFYANGRSSGHEFGVRIKSGKELRIAVDAITGLAGMVKPEVPE